MTLGVSQTVTKLPHIALQMSANPAKSKYKYVDKIIQIGKEVSLTVNCFRILRLYGERSSSAHLIADFS